MTEKEYKKELKNRLITYRNSLDFTDDITFGVEIEYENIVLDTFSSILMDEQKTEKLLLYFKNKREIDLLEYNKYGEEVNGEVASNILKDTLKTWKSLRDVLTLLRDNGAIITEKCGGHVSIGSHILEGKKKYLKNFLLLWILYEEEIYKFSSGEYRCVRPDSNLIFEKISKDIPLEKLLKIKSLKKMPFELTDKSHDIYIYYPIDKKLKIDNRIEFRIPNGTLKEEIWQNYINFFVKFLLASKKDLDIEKTLYKINHNDHNIIELIDYVFNNDLDKENFLIQALKPNKIYQKELSKHIIL